MRQEVRADGTPAVFPPLRRNYRMALGERAYGTEHGARSLLEHFHTVFYLLRTVFEKGYPAVYFPDHLSEQNISGGEYMNYDGSNKSDRRVKSCAAANSMFAYKIK
jgi:hypothetical protein